jgi:hypothetical protein
MLEEIWNAYLVYCKDKPRLWSRHNHTWMQSWQFDKLFLIGSYLWNILMVRRSSEIQVSGSEVLISWLLVLFSLRNACLLLFSKRFLATDSSLTQIRDIQVLVGAVLLQGLRWYVKRPRPRQHPFQNLKEVSFNEITTRSFHLVWLTLNLKMHSPRIRDDILISLLNNFCSIKS